MPIICDASMSSSSLCARTERRACVAASIPGGDMNATLRAVALIGTLAAGGAWGQEFSARPIRILTTSARGRGAAGTGYLAAELFKSMAGVNIVWVPYKAAVEAYAALMNGEAHMMIVDIGPVAPLVKTGKVRLLAVTSLQPSVLAPGVPTIAE